MLVEGTLIRNAELAPDLVREGRLTPEAVAALDRLAAGTATSEDTEIIRAAMEKTVLSPKVQFIADNPPPSNLYPPSYLEGDKEYYICPKCGSTIPPDDYAFALRIENGQFVASENVVPVYKVGSLPPDAWLLAENPSAPGGFEWIPNPFYQAWYCPLCPYG